MAVEIYYNEYADNETTTPESDFIAATTLKPSSNRFSVPEMTRPNRKWTDWKNKESRPPRKRKFRENKTNDPCSRCDGWG